MAYTMTGSATAMEYAGSGAQAIAPSLSITGTPDTFTGEASVQFVALYGTTSSFNANEDVLANTEQLPPSIEVSDFASGKLTFTCTNAAIADLLLVLQRVTYTNTAGVNRTGSQRRVRFTLDGVTFDRWIWLRDPFTQVETELWRILESHASLSGIIKPIKFTGEAGLEDDALDTYQDGDLAAVRLHPEGDTGQTNLGRTSNGSSIGQRFQLEVASGSLATRTRHNRVKWGVAKALAKHLYDHSQGIPLLGLGPVTGARDGIVPQLTWRVSAEAGEQESTDRGRRGWIGLMAIDVTIWISDAQARV